MTAQPPPSLGALVREDFVTHHRDPLHPGFHALLLHRLLRWRHGQPAPVRVAVGAVAKLLNRVLVRNVYGMEVFETTVIGRRLLVGHHMGVVLGAHAVIGDDVLVRQHVTIGQALDGQGQGQPRIGDGVQLGAGCSVLGDVTVGAGARVGPHAVVVTDVPAGATAFAPPARVMRPSTPSPAPAAPVAAEAPGHG